MRQPHQPRAFRNSEAQISQLEPLQHETVELKRQLEVVSDLEERLAISQLRLRTIDAEMHQHMQNAVAPVNAERAELLQALASTKNSLYTLESHHQQLLARFNALVDERSQLFDHLKLVDGPRL